MKLLLIAASSPEITKNYTGGQLLPYWTTYLYPVVCQIKGVENAC